MRSETNEKQKTLFFVDAMLGNIARKLRLLGYDTRYSSHIPDESLIKEAKRESRIIVSKDELLVRIATKQNIPCVLVTKNKEIDQILEINCKVKLDQPSIRGDTARCPSCNGELYRVADKSSVKDKVSPKVFSGIDLFWSCKDCNKVYWEGSHIDNLQNFVSELNEKLQ